MGLMLFEGSDGEKRLSALSGGEAARLVFSRLMMERPNVLVLDEPTNHLDLESIEALVKGLEAFEGTLILVSHDRWFVRQLATRVVEMSADGIRDFPGTYEEYVHALGDDHLDADTVVLKAKKGGKEEKKGGERRNGGGASGNGRGSSGARSAGGRADRSSTGAQGGTRSVDRPALERRRDELTAEIDRLEGRIAEIEAAFARPGYYEQTDPEEVAALDQERTAAQQRVEHLMGEWESVERKLEG